MSFLLIDGARYKHWIPHNEEEEFHPIIKEHARDIFGEKSIYIDVKRKLSTKSGIGSIPDAYVVAYGERQEWYIVEIELSSHPTYSHIVSQVSKFADGIENNDNQRKLLDVLYKEMDPYKCREIEKQTLKSSYRFLSKLLSLPPRIALVIDEVTPQIEQACRRLSKSCDTMLFEIKTYIEEGYPDVHAHVCRSLLQGKLIPKKRHGRIEDSNKS